MAGDEEPVRDLYDAMIDAWNRHDASGYAALFASDGSLVGFDGSCVESSEAIAEHLGSIFADHEPAAYVTKVREVRELGSHAALLRAVAGMVPPGESDIKPEVNTVHALVAIEMGGRWQVAQFQSTPAAFHGRPEESEALTAELRALLPGG